MCTRKSVLMVLLLAVGAFAIATDAAAQASHCRTSNCFYDRNIRSHEVIDDDTLIVYVGKDRCPFLVKVNALNCDLTFLPDVEFIKNRGRNQRMGGNRVCVNESGIALNPMVFGQQDRGIVDNSDPVTGLPFDCRVFELRPVTDDELVELYVTAGIVPPPPPVGTGEISRTDDAASGGAEQGAASDEAGADSGNQ